MNLDIAIHQMQRQQEINEQGAYTVFDLETQQKIKQIVGRILNHFLICIIVLYITHVSERYRVESEVYEPLHLFGEK